MIQFRIRYMLPVMNTVFGVLRCYAPVVVAI